MAILAAVIVGVLVALMILCGLGAILRTIGVAIIFYLWRGQTEAWRVFYTKHNGSQADLRRLAANVFDYYEVLCTLYLAHIIPGDIFKTLFIDDILGVEHWGDLYIKQELQKAPNAFKNFVKVYCMWGGKKI